MQRHFWQTRISTIKRALQDAIRMRETAPRQEVCSLMEGQGAYVSCAAIRANEKHSLKESIIGGVRMNGIASKVRWYRQYLTYPMIMYGKLALTLLFGLVGSYHGISTEYCTRTTVVHEGQGRSKH